MENEWSRRDWIRGMGVASLVLGLGGLSGLAHASEASNLPRQLGECRLPPLPYAADALEPYIDKKTVTIHHDKHHAGYVKKFNRAMQKLEDARATGDFGLIKHWSREFAFNGSGHVLHTLYWVSMSPRGGRPDEELSKAIRRSFGGFEPFIKQFAAACKAVEGSGWGVMAYEPYSGSLVVVQTEKHQDLALWGAVPLLVCDVWEHAYYLRYQNRRGEYVTNFLKIVDWKAVSERYRRVRKMGAMYESTMDRPS